MCHPDKDANSGRHCAPLLGEHVEYVCTQMLGMAPDEFAELAKAGLFV